MAIDANGAGRTGASQTGASQTGARASQTGASLLVAIPCLDEERTVARVVASIPREMPGVAEVEVVVIDDGSSDQTAKLAAEAGARVVVHDRNLGLGVTFREAVELALAGGFDLLVHIDGDGQFDPADIPSLVEPVIEGRADMATASRFAMAHLVPEMPAIKLWGNRRVADIVAVLTGHRFHDVSCGFRAFSSEALLHLNLFAAFTYTQESFVDLVFKGLRVLEVPVAVRGTREFGQSRVASSVLGYGLRSLQIMLRTFISYRPFVFFAAVAAVFAIPGLGLLAFLAAHYLAAGQFSPHIWAGFTGGSFAFLSVSILVLGLVADMLTRMRLNQEELLYRLKSEEWRRRRGARGAQ